VHDSDDVSVMQTVSVHADVVATARSFAGALPVHVSPATLLPPGALEADPRQPSLLAAAWTAGSAAGLAAAGVASATYFELCGDAGLMRAGAAFPAYHELCAWRGAPLLSLTAGDPLRVAGLAVGTSRGPRVMAANLTPDAAEVVLQGMGGAPVSVRVLDATTAREAGPTKGAWKTAAGAAPALQLGPYAVAFVTGR
jgi:hypothetical protein